MFLNKGFLGEWQGHWSSLGLDTELNKEQNKRNEGFFGGQLNNLGGKLTIVSKLACLQSIKNKTNWCSK